MRIEVYLILLCALFGLTAPSRTAGAGLSAAGVVLTVKGQPVARVTVSIVNAGSTTTTDSGQFAVPLPQGFQVGFPLMLIVEGWVVESPWEGRGIVPASIAVPLEVRVVSKGDKVILSHDNVTRIVKGQVTRISELSTGGNYAGPTLQADKEQEAYLRKQADILGFPVEKLRTECDSWTRKPENEFEQGLAALYQGRNEEASQALRRAMESASSSGVPQQDRLAALASAEYRLGHYSEARKVLSNLQTQNPYDVRLITNLATIAEAERDYGRALALLRAAATIDQVSGDKVEAEAIEEAVALTRIRMDRSKAAAH